MACASWRPLDVLRDEHDLIRQYLNNLDIAVAKIESSALPPRELFDKALRFDREFAGEFHHYKEEDVMFARLAQKLNGAVAGQLDALRKQHDGARSYLAALNTALDGYAAGQPLQIERVKTSVAAYIFLLRNHIHVEDQAIFPLVAKTISTDEERQLYLEFEMARKKAGRDAFEVNRELVAEMRSMLSHD